MASAVLLEAVVVRAMNGTLVCALKNMDKIRLPYVFMH